MKKKKYVPKTQTNETLFCSKRISLISFAHPNRLVCPHIATVRFFSLFSKMVSVIRDSMPLG